MGFRPLVPSTYDVAFAHSLLLLLLADKYDVSVSALEDFLHNPKKAAAAAEERLRAAAHEAEDRLKGVRAV